MGGDMIEDSPLLCKTESAEQASSVIADHSNSTVEKFTLVAGR